MVSIWKNKADNGFSKMKRCWKLISWSPSALKVGYGMLLRKIKNPTKKLQGFLSKYLRAISARVDIVSAISYKKNVLKHCSFKHLFICYGLGDLNTCSTDMGHSVDNKKSRFAQVWVYRMW